MGQEDERTLGNNVWEYRCVVIGDWIDPVGKLNNEGKNGWECYAAVRVGEKNTAHFLKRRIVEECLDGIGY